MAANGGAALAVGIWYQSLGGTVALVAPWTFSGAGPNIHAQSFGVSDSQQLQLLLEYFDMDTAIRDQRGVQLIQFKVSSQQEPRSFAPDEVRDILRNATQAILRHERGNTEPITGFIVASNRDPGDHFTALKQAIKDSGIMDDGADSLAALARAPAPPSLFPKKNERSESDTEPVLSDGENDDDTGQPSTTKTMDDLARSIVWGKAREWGSTFDQCITACLKAMANFAFAKAHPAKLEDELYQWLRTWGILADEYERYAARILGELQLPSNDGEPWNTLSIMRRVFEAPSAIPITPHEIWPTVIDDLRNRRWPDPPTRILITQRGMADWMLDRSALLRGLPYSFAEDPTVPSDREERYFVDTNRPARVFALVGPGGTGKSALLAQLFAEIGRGVWDWDTDSVRPDPKFIGYPVILEADINILDGISGALGKWGHRGVAVDRPIERFATTNKIAETGQAVWVGFDGIDEVPAEHLIQIARALSNCVDSHPQVRLVLTSRPEQLNSVLSILNAKGLLRRLVIEEFDIDEAREAVLQATNRELRLKPRATDIIAAGRTSDPVLIPQSLEPGEFERSMTQPLFIGVIQRVYIRDNRIDLIQAAYDEDPLALSELAQEYVYVLCERMQRRLHQNYVSERMIFNALKQLAADVTDPPRANHTDWMKVCRVQLNDLVVWGVLNAQCAASGLIRDLGSGAFEWRHPFVGRYLSAMKESRAWQ